MEQRRINSPDAPAPPSHYSQALEVKGAQRLLFVSGQIPVAGDGSLAKDFPTQARQAWANVEAQLRAAGMTLDNVAKVTIFLADRRHAMDNRAVRQEVLGERAPALTVIITGIFDESWLIEIEAIAAA
jgi:enamine deaminase RidA (YjgF/YER057c/UK114 family)